ncbi:hypothetical protein PHSC3_000284 [Chlamydiales bacterium STE3]|nr:hypothetical protein PHSC3_000284 [Chlamydiales bacterium STE3]
MRKKMSITAKYFDLVIEKDHFYIVGSSQKYTEEDSAARTLKKILFVVENNLSYSPTRYDNFSELPKEILFEILEYKTSEIAQRFISKHMKENWFVRVFSGKEDEIKVLQSKIVNAILPPELFLLPTELIQQILSHVGIKDLARFSRLSSQGRNHSLISLHSRARLLGYEGDNVAEGAQYLKQYFVKRGMAREYRPPRKRPSFYKSPKNPILRFILNEDSTVIFRK